MISVFSVSKIILAFCIATECGTGQCFTRLGVQVNHAHANIASGKIVFSNNIWGNLEPLILPLVKEWGLILYKNT